MKFAPLHIITGYSFLKSGLTVNKVARAVKTNDYFGMGLTDVGVMYGFPSFVETAGLIKKPCIVGEQISLDNNEICLYVLNEEGYRNLIQITLVHQKGELDSAFINKHNEGLLAVLETVRGEFKDRFVENYDDSFNRYLLDLSKLFKEFYLGIEVTKKEEVKFANRIRLFADKFNYQCVAFPRIRYEKKDDAITLMMVRAIANNEVLETKKAVGQDYFMKEEDYSKIYTKIEMENTIEIIKKSKFNFAQKRGQLLHYPVDDSKAELSRICYEKLSKIGLNDEKHEQRLAMELGVISSLKYDDYFLIVNDFVNYAKTHDVLVGPGRGSAAGSLVSFLLGITEVDPLEYDLQFERFLNIHRKTMPDIDVDFMDTARDQMVEYMKTRYGAERVAKIVTFQTIGAKQALEDISKIYGYPRRHTSMLSKAITGKDCSLREAYKTLPAFKSIVDSDPYFLEIVSLASKIEGLPRQSSLHTAGIVINEDPLSKVVPVSWLPEDNYTVEYEKDYLEPQGLLKMDFLSLANLTIIYNCIKLINKANPDIKLRFEDIPYKEKVIFDLIRSGRNLGLFQINTEAMKKSIALLKPSCFDDVVAVLELGRPGPMKKIPLYVNRRDGKSKVTYISKDLEEILSPTYGIVVYQEQVNSVAVKMAGFTLSEADMFRRAISKKDKQTLLDLQNQFIEGSKKNGYSENDSKKMFADILEFADYGFNKSHSVVYAIITCRMAWLKAHYPLQFYCAILDKGAAARDALFRDYINEMKTFGINMLPPSINYSSDAFEIKDNNLLLPLSAIKDINNDLANKIRKETEENGLFNSFFNFVLRMYSKGLKQEQVHSLISGGAFDELYPSRASMHLSVMSSFQYAALNHSSDGQLTIGIELIAPPRMNKAEDNPIENLDKEFDVLGTMISSSPLSYYKEKLDQKNVSPISYALEANESTIAGIVSKKKIVSTKKGEQMAFVRVFDDSASIELTIFPKLYKEASALIEQNNLIIAKIKKQDGKEETNYLVNEISKLED